MTIAVNYTTWIFPRPGFTVPEIPVPRGRSLARWYLDYCLANNTSAIKYSWEWERRLYQGDVLEPYWIDSLDSRSNASVVNVLRMFCLWCDNAWKYSHLGECFNSTTEIIELTQSFNVSTSESRYPIMIPEPNSQVYIGSDYSSEYICTLQRESSLEEQALDRQAFSSIFFVSGNLRPTSERFIHNLSYPNGVPLHHDYEEQAAVPSFAFPPARQMTKLRRQNGLSTHQLLSWPSSKRVKQGITELNYYTMDEPVFHTPANIQADDILEPRWIEHSSQPAKSLGLACIVCPEKNGTRSSAKWHCDNFVSRNMIEFYLPIEFHSPGGAGMEVRMPSSRYFDTVAACAFHLNFSTPSGADVVLSSHVFFVADGPSVREEQHRFNITQTSGAPTGLYRGNLSDSKSTDFYSSFGFSHGSSGMKRLGPGAIVGVILGSIFGALLILWLWKRYSLKDKKTGMQAERDAVECGEADVHPMPQQKGKGALTS